MPRHAAARTLAFALALSAFAAAPADAARGPATGPATGRASVQLVRFLDEVPETARARYGPIHDVRLRLERGYVLLVRRGGEFAAILPIETRAGAADSLQYVWFLERGPILWVIPGGHDRGIRLAADGGEIRFDSFVLRWGKGGDFGWIYFPDVPENRGVSFSVVSGRSVDRADPRDTRYWVELGGTGGKGGGGF